MSDSTCPSPEELSFGDALAELDVIVASLEGGQLELEDSLSRYERGVTLLRTLQSKLADAQQKVTMLIGELESEAGEAAPSAEATPGPEPAAGLADREETVPF